MTDNEAIKNFEDLVMKESSNLSLRVQTLLINTLVVIYRQKTKIERLQITSSFCHKSLTDAWKRIEELDKLNETAKSKAIKAFVEKVNRRLNSIAPRGAYLYNIMRECEKEMVGDDNA